MRYAITERGKHTEVEISGERGLCPDCNSVVIGHNGKIVTKHWKHHKTTNCDSWYEPITQWHLSWQDLFPENYREITITKEDSKHRADLKLGNGLVIEIQNSPIAISEIEKRESFYGDDKMIWIINGGTLANNSRIVASFVKKQFQLTIEIPSLLEEVEQYDFDRFRESILGKDILQSLLSRSNDHSIQNGCLMIFDFDYDIGLHQLRMRLSSVIEEEFEKRFGAKALNDFRFQYSVKFLSFENDHYAYVKLIKKNWRKFIDLFTFPVFIDNLLGLENDKLYWYQKNKIISKEQFLEKYLKYCQ